MQQQVVLTKKFQPNLNRQIFMIQNSRIIQNKIYYLNI